jgi:hypothetical protein
LSADHLLSEAVEWDITRYAERVPKNPSKSGTKGSNEKEAALRKRHPPLNGFTASMPCIIIDMQGFILVWYLPGILTDSRQAGLFFLSDHSRKPDAYQNAMSAAQEKLHPLLKIPPHGSSWRNDRKFYYPGEGPQGSVNLSPAWFQQGHDVSASSHKFYISAAHSELGNGARIPACFYKLQGACCTGLAKCHLRIECNFERHPCSYPPQAL